ncbi:MAG TPA: FBP domain-containing protein [Actinospica sp.]|nr:FBP domain-containing protein [Actinospica sp.]
MEALTEARVRDCFVNCTKGEAQRINLPGPLDAVYWEQLDFLGWRDAKAELRAYMVVPWKDDVVGIVLRRPQRSRGGSLLRSTMCSICLTVHASSGVTHFAAAKAGAAGRAGNSVGNYICSDLQCSRYVRGYLRSEAATSMEESLDPAEKVLRLRAKLEAFTRGVLGDEL